MCIFTYKKYTCSVHINILEVYLHMCITYNWTYVNTYMNWRDEEGLVVFEIWILASGYFGDFKISMSVSSS